MALFLLFPSCAHGACSGCFFQYSLFECPELGSSVQGSSVIAFCVAAAAFPM